MIEVDVVHELQAIEAYLHNFDDTLLDRGVFPADLDRFKGKFTQFLSKLPKIQKEGALENHIKEWLHPSVAELKGEVGTDKKYNFDVAVCDAQGQMISLMECKHAGNKTQMLSLTNINCKALKQALLYYITAVKVDNRNTFKDMPQLKHIIITNGYEWFWLAQKDLHALVMGDKATPFKHQGQTLTLLEAHTQIDKNETFYQVAGSFIAQHEEKLRAIIYLLNLKKLNVESLTDQQWSVLYHLFSPAVLLNHHKITDANTLNQRFYQELLHIMGLKETMKGKGDNAIPILVANPSAVNSLYDQVSKRLSTEGFAGDELFEKNLTIIILWINRLLFLKLLEAHIVNAHINPQQGNDEAAWAEYGFMATDKITDGRLLDSLFFEVLAKQWSDREERLHWVFAHVPYLNSSLFALDKKLESVRISALHDEPLTLHKNSVVRGEAALPVLTYLLTFLKTYDFATNGASKKGQNVKALEDRLINASVLGKVFEKLNGYKDGSFFTPSYITTFICQQTIEQALVSRVNAALPQMAMSFTDYDDLKKTFELWGNNRKDDYIHTVQEIIKTLTVVDPAVGSGHFLVSALNELLRIRYDFNLMHGMGDAKEVSLRVMNDEIIIRRPNNALIYYYVGDAHSQRVQEELFKHKQEIIENNLFGVDINANSVSICHLRLWIELLKSSYYQRSDAHKKGNLAPTLKENGNNPMETLPNIDINIKVGNSLVSKLPLVDDHELSKKELDLVKRYTSMVQEYKRATKNKREVIAELEDVQKALYFTFKPLELFTDLQVQAKKDAQMIDLYANAIEWRMAFPEVLDAQGKFKGFDVVVANPPYFVIANDNSFKSVYEQQWKYLQSGRMNIYQMFYGLAHNLLVNDGLLGYINPKTVLTDSYLKATRTFLQENMRAELFVDFIDRRNMFETVTQSVIVNMFVKTKDKTKKTRFAIVKNEHDFQNVQYVKRLETEIIDKRGMYIIARDQRTYDIVKKMEQVPLFDNLKFGTGKLEWNKYKLYLSEQPVADSKILFYAEHVQRFQLIKPTKRTLLYLNNYAQPLPVLTKTALVVQRTTSVEQPYRIIAMQVNPADYPYPLITENHTSFTLVTENNTSFTTDLSEVEQRYVLGILNSRLMDFYFRFINSNTHVSSGELNHLPIAKLTPIQQAEVVALVDRIIATKKANQLTTALENSLDTLVYHLYNLTLEEMTLIDSAYQ
jgi:adenine-specific DNA-methyltransferase